MVYRFRVQNTGNGTDQFALVATSSRAWRIVMPGGAFTDPLSPGPGGGSRETVEVQIGVPVTETIDAEDVLTLTATSEFDPGVSADASVTTTVAKPRGGGQP